MHAPTIRQRIDDYRAYSELKNRTNSLVINADDGNNRFAVREIAHYLAAPPFNYSGLRTGQGQNGFTSLDQLVQSNPQQIIAVAKAKIGGIEHKLTELATGIYISPYRAENSDLKRLYEFAEAEGMVEMQVRYGYELRVRIKKLGRKDAERTFGRSTYDIFREFGQEVLPLGKA